MSKAGSAAKVKLSSYDDLFGNAEEKTGSEEQIIRAKLTDLHEFRNHPFRVLDDEKMEETTESISKYGVLVPGIARPRAEGGYEIIAGHRRKRGSERAGKEDMPEDAERKGLGTPATRAAVIEKLVATGFAERKKAKKSVRLVPTEAGVSLITVLPEQLQSPLLTAEWEHRLKEIECGELGADEFLAGIRDMVAALVRDAAPVDGAEVLFPSGRPVVGKCPRCGAEVTESKNGYFCERRSCKFGLWRDNRFLAAKKISLTKKMASSLLTQGRAYASGVYSEKTGKTYDAFIVLEDDGARSSYKLDFTK